MEIPFELSDKSMDQIGAVMQKMAVKAFKEAGERQKFGPYMTKQEAAKYVHVSQQTLNEFIRQGLQVTTVGSISRVSKVSADRFMEQHQI
ncbi:helix-turn-helix domain-containing protein [Levilactobacillus brevis]|uniref:helix-turn-helix domain-containing protein n=1 Tax=Levilactobacillus brevis TaxID=1580 RepID=UPI0035A348BE